MKQALAALRASLAALAAPKLIDLLRAMQAEQRTSAAVQWKTGVQDERVTVTVTVWREGDGDE